MQLRVWLSADGYRDPDDNLALLVGAAQARVTAKSGDSVQVAGTSSATPRTAASSTC